MSTIKFHLYLIDECAPACQDNLLESKKIFSQGARFWNGPSLDLLITFAEKAKVRSKTLDQLTEVEIAIAAKEQAVSYLRTKREHTNAKFKKPVAHWSSFA